MGILGPFMGCLILGWWDYRPCTEKQEVVLYILQFMAKRPNQSLPSSRISEQEDTFVCGRLTGFCRIGFRSRTKQSNLRISMIWINHYSSASWRVGLFWDSYLCTKHHLSLFIIIWRFPKMEGTPKSSILNHPFAGIPGPPFMDPIRSLFVIIKSHSWPWLTIVFHRFSMFFFFVGPPTGLAMPVGVSWCLSWGPPPEFQAPRPKKTLGSNTKDGIWTQKTMF